MSTGFGLIWLPEGNALGNLAPIGGVFTPITDIRTFGAGYASVWLNLSDRPNINKLFWELCSKLNLTNIASVNEDLDFAAVFLCSKLWNLNAKHLVTNTNCILLFDFAHLHISVSDIIIDITHNVIEHLLKVVTYAFEGLVCLYGIFEGHSVFSVLKGFGNDLALP